MHLKEMSKSSWFSLPLLAFLVLFGRFWHAVYVVSFWSGTSLARKKSFDKSLFFSSFSSVFTLGLGHVLWSCCVACSDPVCFRLCVWFPPLTPHD